MSLSLSVSILGFLINCCFHVTDKVVDFFLYTQNVLRKLCTRVAHMLFSASIQKQSILKKMYISLPNKLSLPPLQTLCILGFYYDCNISNPPLGDLSMLMRLLSAGVSTAANYCWIEMLASAAKCVDAP